VVEVDGRTLWSHAADRALPPASLTKIMTALVFLESGKPLDGVVTVSVRAQRATGSRLGLKAGSACAPRRRSRPR
jgi:D-alanyl-D-alanine carboxypeptidase (penicillin-binding protein 5/6)